MAILAKTSLRDFQACYQQLPQLPNYDFLRSPEIGLVMVRGRTGGTGNPFNTKGPLLAASSKWIAITDSATLPGDRTVMQK